MGAGAARRARGPGREPRGGGGAAAAERRRVPGRRSRDRERSGGAPAAARGAGSARARRARGGGGARSRHRGARVHSRRARQGGRGVHRRGGGGGAGTAGGARGGRPEGRRRARGGACPTRGDRSGAGRERAGRAAARAEQGGHQGASLAGESAAIDHDTATLTGQQTQWQDALKERKLALGALEAAATDAGTQVQGAEAGLAQAEGTLTDVRRALDALGAEEHKLELERTEILGRKRGLAERVEAEWRKPLDQLLADAPVVAGDLAWLRQENERLQGAIDAVGPVNALAVEEHAEEMKRLEFLMTQRDDLVAARQSLQQAAREIDRTAKAMFLESFGKVRENFRAVFQTLFGGGECDVRLANEDEPLESEIEIHAAPRGKRTQRIHLLS